MIRVVNAFQKTIAYIDVETKQVFLDVDTSLPTNMLNALKVRAKDKRVYIPLVESEVNGEQGRLKEG